MYSKKVTIFSTVCVIMILFFLFSCDKKEISYVEQFDLKRYKVKNYDLYNPILNTYKINLESRKKHPDYYYFNVYFDANDIIRYSYFRSDSYGYLQKIIYNGKGKISKTEIYPILVDSVDKNSKVYINQYFYIDEKLRIFKDELNGELILMDGGNANIYKGIISSTNDQFQVKNINIKDYFVHLLH